MEDKKLIKVTKRIIDPKNSYENFVVIIREVWSYEW